MKDFNGSKICGVNPNGVSYGNDPFGCGFRPCISLKSDIIKITEGEGTKESPYVIGK